MVTKIYKIFGENGHRQRESFSESYLYDFTNGENVRILEVFNSDKTGTNQFSIMKITRNTLEECEQECFGQLNDGIFENSRTGKVEEITEKELQEILSVN